jgi:hypothetical protein
MNHYKIWVVHDAGTTDGYELSPRVYMDRWVNVRPVPTASELKNEDVGVTSVNFATHFLSESQARHVVYYLGKLFPLREFKTVKFVTKIVLNRRRKPRTSKSQARADLPERRLDTHL